MKIVGLTGSLMSPRSLKYPTRAVLSRLGMRQHNPIVDDPETVDLGKYTSDMTKICYWEKTCQEVARGLQQQ